MKTRFSFLLVLLRIFLILSVAGLCVDLVFATVNLLSHHFRWDGFILKYYNHIDFNKIWAADKTCFTMVLLSEILTNLLKIGLFISALKLLTIFKKDLPFTGHASKLMYRITGLSFMIAFVGFCIKAYIEVYVNNDILLSTQVGDTSYFWLAAIFYIMTLIYEKGLFLQSENDLTI